MSEHLGYIDSYFNKELSVEECRIFDLRIEQDPAFAEEVAFYLTTLNTAKAELATQKKERFREIYNEIRPAQRPSLVRKLLPYFSAAAVLLLVLATILFLNASTPVTELADQYIEKNLIELSPVLGTEDSLEIGKTMYNNGNFVNALQIFEALLERGISHDEIIRYAGITSLRLEKYDKALTYFKDLENIHLEINQGKLLRALTLMKRNQPGDKEEAKIILKSIVDQELYGKDIAANWLKEF